MPVDALLAQECQLEPVGGGAYERECSRAWWGFQAQHGGYVLGLAITAVDMELEGSDMAIQHATMQYLRPFLDGPFRAEVQVERRGRTMANATVRMWSQGKLAGLAFNRAYAFHSVGALGAVELTAPDRARLVNAGLRRLGVAAGVRQYYALHATLDIKHSATWNAEVIAPLVEAQPETRFAIAEGALMRLRAGERCFERYRRELGVDV